MFLPFVIDVYARRVIGWRFNSSMRTDLVLDALRMALSHRRHGADLELVHHSGAGSQTPVSRFSKSSTNHRVLQSIGTVGDAFDNALVESFVDTLETELIAGRVWRTRSQLELAIVERVAWFDTERLPESLTDLPQCNSTLSTLRRPR